MFILIRALTYATLFIGLVLIFLPRGILSSTGITQPSVTGTWQIAGMFLGMTGAILALSCIFTFVFVGKGTPAEEPTLRRTFGDEYKAYCDRVGRWGPRW